MKPQLQHVGESRTPIVVVDGFSGRVGELVDLAVELLPFPALRQNNYPGLRRIITPRDYRADAYVEQILTQAAQFIAGGFDIDRFDLVEASFSMVTSEPQQLQPVQRAPHFDTTDPKHLAVLLYLNVPANSGTAFYRQRATGIEVVTDANVDRFVETARNMPPEPGYIAGSTSAYEQIHTVAARPDRLIIYPGSLLHSGIIPVDMTLSADPRVGRLTANIFVRAT